MKIFLAKYGYLLIWAGAILLVGIAFWFVIQANSRFTPLSPTSPSSAVNPGPPPSPPSPSVTFTVQKSSKGNTLRVQWANLPADTTGLNIFRSPKDKNQWSLWKHIAITPDELAGGSFSVNIGSSLYVNYSFYITATSGGGGGGDTSSTQILWTSSSTIATVTTSNTSTSTAPSSQNAASSTTSPTSTSSGTTSGGGTAPTGTPYYTPQLQISSYGSSPSGNFWVQHVDQKIQMGWQNLPANATNISVFRSPNQNGPWTTVLTQMNPGVNGAYSIQIVDNTLGQPYYYEMQAFEGNSVIATYGPVYLPPVGQ